MIYELYKHWSYKELQQDAKPQPPNLHSSESISVKFSTDSRAFKPF
jgi:hypothetical protein